jgi:hypothetical protein
VSQPVQHVDVGVAQDRAQRDRLARLGDEEAAAAFARKPAGDGREAQPVGIGLDDGGAFGAAGPVAQQPPVGGDRVEIDRQDRAGKRGFGVRCLGQL